MFPQEEMGEMNQSKIAWITDTTASLSKEFIEKHNIHVIPLQVVINQESFKETVDISQEEFYERMKNETGTFQTSQPSIGDFVDLYKKLREEYDVGIAIHASVSCQVPSRLQKWVQKWRNLNFWRWIHKLVLIRLLS